MKVAPHVGAWIEISCSLASPFWLYLSHPMWVRGLKYIALFDVIIGQSSHPMWVRGLK